MTLLRIEDLTLELGGRRLLDGVSLELARGEVVGLVGESGSGKSLTGLSVIGLTPPDANIGGRILYDGEDLVAATERRRVALRGAQIGLVFQEPMTALNPLMCIGDQIAEAARLGLAAAAARARALSLLERVGLAGIDPGRYPHELSGGQRQRVAIAIALARDPAILIADEPTTALDVTTQAVILDLLSSLVREEGMGLLLISHDLAVISRVAGRIAVMQDGRIVEQGASETIIRSPAHLYTQRLIADSVLPAKPPSAPNAEPPVLEAVTVTRRYPGRRNWLGRRAAGVEAVSDVSFSIQPGETVALVGESGSGKSTLVRTVLGLDTPQAGAVRVGGEAFGARPGREANTIRRRIQVVLQDPYSSFDPRWTIERIVAEPLNLLEQQLSPVERRAKVEAALVQVGLTADAADRLPHQFSGGQRQRIAIARAIIVEPRVLVMDEAVSALDVTVRAGILRLLQDLTGRLGMGCLFVTHDMAVARSIADRVLVMHRGRIVESGATAQIFDAPMHDYTADLIAATPAL